MSFNYITFAKSIMTNVGKGVSNDFQGSRDLVEQAYIASESFIKEQPEVHKAAVSNKEDLSNKISYMIDSIVNSEIAKENGFNYSRAQLAASQMIAPLAFAGSKAISENLGKLSSSTAFDSSNLPSDAVDFAIAKEAYDGSRTDTNYLYSIVYNFVAAKQEELVEMFYPTVVVDPALANIVVELKFASIMDEVIRPADGGLNKPMFNKKSLAKAIYDESVFGTDRNRLFPIFNDENKELYLEEAKRSEKHLGNELITVAPIRFGKEFNILGISQTAKQLSKGLADHTEALDRAVYIKDLYLSLTGDHNTEEFFKFDVSKMSTNNFVYNPQNHNKDLILNCIDQVVSFSTRDTKTIRGTDSVILNALNEGYIVDVMFSISGNGNTQYGDIILSGTNIKLLQIRDKAGTILPTEDEKYKNIAKVFESVKLVAYELFAHSVNSNLRKRAQLVTCDSYKEAYTIPVRSGLMTMVPVNNVLGSDNDIDTIVAPAQYLGAKMSMYGINELFSLESFLSEITNRGAKQAIRPADDYGFKSVSKHVLYPAYTHSNVNLTTLVSSIESKSRDEDVRKAILQEIVNLAMILYTDSNYIVAFQNVLGGNGGAKPQLIVGTEPNIERLLVVDGKNEFEVGNVFTIKIVSTPNPKFKGKIVFSFGVKDIQKESVVNPLHFGFTGYAPNIVYDLPRDSSNGATSHERHYQPRFIHVSNLPILGVITVSGIEDVFKQLRFRTTNV